MLERSRAALHWTAESGGPGLVLGSNAYTTFLRSTRDVCLGREQHCTRRIISRGHSRRLSFIALPPRVDLVMERAPGHRRRDASAERSCTKEREGGGVVCRGRAHPSFVTLSRRRSSRVVGRRLQLLHGGHVGGLDVVLVRLDLLLQLVQRDLVVLDDQVDLQLVHARGDGHALRRTPDEAVLFDGAHALFELGHVGFVICARLAFGLPVAVRKGGGLYPMA